MALISLPCVLAYAVSIASTALAFQPPGAVEHFRIGRHRQSQAPPRILPLRDSPDNVDSTPPSLEISPEVDDQSLVVMDVVLFQRRPPADPSATQETLELGAVQENGNVAPLSAWTLESAYTSDANDMLAFVASEEDAVPGLPRATVRVVRVLDGDVTGYGARQVGGGKGPGNPHGEESELLYYVDRAVVEGRGAAGGDGAAAPGMAVDVVVDPGLEHLW